MFGGAASRVMRAGAQQTPERPLSACQSSAREACPSARTDSVFPWLVLALWIWRNFSCKDKENQGSESWQQAAGSLRALLPGLTRAGEKLARTTDPASFTALVGRSSALHTSIPQAVPGQVKTSASREYHLEEMKVLPRGSATGKSGKGQGQHLHLIPARKRQTQAEL